MEATSRQASNPLAEWLDNFNADVKALHDLLDLRTRLDNYAARDTIEPVLSSFSDRLSLVEHATDFLHRHVQNERRQVSQLREFSRRVETQTARINLIRAQLPQTLASNFAQLPIADIDKFAISTVPSSSKVSASPAKENNPSAENSVNTPRVLSSSSAQPTPRGGIVSTNRPPSAPKSKARAMKNKAESSNGNSQSDVFIRPVSKSELDAAPQYVRGRMTIEKLNAVANRLSEIAASKYSIIGRPNNSLSSAELSFCHDFQEANCEETAGHKFLTDNEIKGFGDYRIDSTVKAAINILRHVGLLKEVRGKKNTRILIIVDAE